MPLKIMEDILQRRKASKTEDYIIFVLDPLSL